MEFIKKLFFSGIGFIILLTVAFLGACLFNTLFKISGDTDGFGRLYAFIPTFGLLIGRGLAHIWVKGA